VLLRATNLTPDRGGGGKLSKEGPHEIKKKKKKTPMSRNGGGKGYSEIGEERGRHCTWPGFFHQVWKRKKREEQQHKKKKDALCDNVPREKSPGELWELKQMTVYPEYGGKRKKGEKGISTQEKRCLTYCRRLREEKKKTGS